MAVDTDDTSTSSATDPDAARLLAEQAAAGSHAAWERIYRAAYPRLRAYAATRVGIVAADDVVSETMLRAVANIARFRWTGMGIDPWLFGIARRVVAEHHRQVDRQRRHPHDPIVPSGRDPVEAVEVEEDRARLRAALALLPERDREVLELRVVAGLSPEAVAQVLGKRPGAIRTAQSRALGKLRRRLGER